MIGSFAFLIVIFTSLVVALVSSAVIPGFTMALGFLLGGITSPPDAVSAISVLKYVKVPKRMEVIIKGESLFNDASSLIVFRFALIAVDTGHFIFREAALSFIIVIAMGILIGVLIGMAYYAIHRWLPTTPDMDVVLSLTAPYVMYIAAERFHFSGVLSVVSGGLFLSARSHLFLSSRSRLRGSNVWSKIGFVLNGLVFMLIGLALPVIIRELGPVSFSGAIGYGVLITAVLIVTRLLTAIGASYFTVWVSQYITTADPRPGLKAPLIFGWAGMRGVVSLAAALSIPNFLSDGSPFPERNLILFITFMVILLTLVVQGLTLPKFIKWIKLEDPDHLLSGEEQNDYLRKKLAHKSIAWLNQAHRETLKPNKAVQRLEERFETDQLYEDEDKNQEQEDYRTIYMNLLEHQRNVLHEMNKKMETDEGLIRKYLGMLDLEEEKLRIRYEAEED